MEEIVTTLQSPHPQKIEEQQEPNVEHSNAGARLDTKTKFWISLCVLALFFICLIVASVLQLNQPLL